MWLVNSVKGLFGSEDLKVESGGHNEDNLQTHQTQEREGLWKQLSGMIGKDVTSMISLPVWIFEPLSMLQIMCEPMQNADLLFKAAHCEDSAERMAYMVAFVAAGYSYATRNKKPFNPILGETFEYKSSSQNWKFFAEQVSHHPPISVSEAYCDDFKLNLEMAIKTAFRGNSSDVHIEGTNHITFPKLDEHITWSHLGSCAHNVLIGSMWVDHFGTLHLTNHKTKEVGSITFNKSGWLGSGRWELNGFVNTPEGKPKLKVFGKWNGKIFCQHVNEQGQLTGEPKLLWEKEKPYSNKWNFPSKFTENLNEMDEEYQKILPETDSRLRGDRLNLEKGDNDKAGKEKHRLEEKQRAEKKDRVAKNITYEPKYFKKEEEHDQLSKTRWVKAKDYWMDQQERLSQVTTTPSGETSPAVVEAQIETLTLKEN